MIYSPHAGYPWCGFNMDFIEWYVNWPFEFLSPIKLIGHFMFCIIELHI